MSIILELAIKGITVPLLETFIALSLYSRPACCSINCQVTPVAVPVFIILDGSRLLVFIFLLNSILNSMGKFLVGST